MTDQPGRPPEERLPAPVPSSAPEPADRFSAPPSAHRNDLTPERAAKIVRQSANARWVGFLAVTIVGLFVIGYYFYELGLPGGLTEPRLEAAASDSRSRPSSVATTSTRRTARSATAPTARAARARRSTARTSCSPTSTPSYLHNVMQVGGRYACGDPNSIMPIWANTGNPPGPLNYKQIEDVIAFIRAEKTGPFRVMDPALFEPVDRPETRARRRRSRAGSTRTTTRRPDATPFPACWTDEFDPAPSASGSLAGRGARPPAARRPIRLARASGSPAPPDRPAPSGERRRDGSTRARSTSVRRR